MKRIACKVCGAHILGDAMVCSVCGSPRPDESAKRYLVFLLVLIGVVVIAYGIWLYAIDFI